MKFYELEEMENLLMKMDWSIQLMYERQWVRGLNERIKF